MLLLDWSSSNFVSSRPLCHFRLFPTADTQKLMSFSSLSFSGKGMIKVLNAVVYPLAVLIQSDYAGRRRNVNPVVVVSSKPFFDCATAGKDKKKKKSRGRPNQCVQSPWTKKKEKIFFSLYSLLLRLFALSSICWFIIITHKDEKDKQKKSSRGWLLERRRVGEDIQNKRRKKNQLPITWDRERRRKKVCLIK